MRYRRVVQPPRTFHVLDARAVLEPLAAEHPFAIEPQHRWFEATDSSWRVYPPPLAPIADEQGGLYDWLASLPDALGVHGMVLLQAGAAALGWFEGGELVASKSLRRYVVRGTGRAQPTHLATRGKSRYGSRLRLRNAAALLTETNERLAAWWELHGAPDALLVNCPVRLWASLLEADPPPPFDDTTRVLRIGRDLPRPTSDLLERTYRFCCYGRIESGAGSDVSST